MIDRNSAGKVSFAASQYSKEKEYWLNKFQGELRKSHFPYDYFPKGKDKEEEENEQQKEKEIVTFNFSREISSELIKLSKNLDHRLYMILAAGLVALLYKYTGNDDIIIGSPIFKQAREGNYINTVLPLRIEVDEGINFKELLLHIVRPAVTGATEHQNYPIETLLFQLHMPMIGKEFPLFDAVILLENIQEKKYIEHVYPNFIFSFLRTDEGDINAELEYNACLYKAGTAVRIATHFKNLIEKAIMALDTLLSKIDILSDAEKEQQLMIFNGPQTEYPWDRS
ncbi:MAG: condensation domain-containing protein, partial [Acidobacteria bacterium]|nr:condensation domain-containing protein [Acidobacteriota bacterium]